MSFISRFIPELQPSAEKALQDQETRKAFLSISADVLNAVYERADLRFNPRVQPRMNSSVPGGKYPPGTDPGSIKEPNLRAEYEKILAIDRSYAEHYTQQTAIFREIDRMAQLVCQTGKTESFSEVRDALVAEGMRASYAEDFLRRLGDRPPKP